MVAFYSFFFVLQVLIFSSFLETYLNTKEAVKNFDTKQIIVNTEKIAENEEKISFVKFLEVPNSPFKNPQGIAASGDKIFIVDQGNRRIVILNEKFELQKELTNEELETKVPGGVAIDKHNQHFIVADGGFHHVKFYTLDGELVKSIGSTRGNADGQFSRPDYCVYDSKNQLLVADGGNNRIQVFSENGEYLSSFGSEGKGDRQFSSPVGVAVNSVGEIVVVDRNNHRVVVYDKDFNFVRKFGSQGKEEGQFQYPVVIALDEKDNIYVVDQANHRIQMFNSEGIFVLSFGSEGTEEKQFKYPWDIEIDGTQVLVADSGNSRVHVWKTNNLC